MSLESLEATRVAIASTANHFRLGMDTQANTALVDVVDGLASPMASGTVPAAGEVQEIVGLVVEAQTRGDVLRVADLLEHEIVPRLVAAPDATTFGG